MRISIRYQLLLPLLALLLGVVGASTWTALASASRARRHIETQMEAVADTVSAVTFPRNRPTLNLMKGLSGAELLLCDQHKQPLIDAEDHPLTTLPGLPTSLPPPGDGAADPLGVLVRVGDQNYFCKGAPLGHDVTAGLVLYLFYPESLYRDALWQAVQPALILGVGGGLVAMVLWVVVAQRLTRRFQELERRTRLIAAGDFSPMPLPHRNDELRDLGRSVNDMAQQLAAYQETSKKTERLRLLGQVSGGLAHQLRNGVTGARLSLQLHARECPGGKDDETLAVALRQLGLMEMHLRRFFDLGKALELRRKSCDLAALLSETLALLGPKFQHTGIDLRQDLPGPSAAFTLQGDPEQLGHVLLNVLTNAVEAAGPGGWVEVRLSMPRPQRALLEVTDSGPGPTPEVADKLFEPFVTGKPEGVGLGLAVARQVAEAHGGTITWSRESRGTCFRVELPLGP